MEKGKKDNYKTLIAQRVEKLIDLSGLEVIGFALFANISESHLYAILNGNRELTEDIAKRIGSAFDISGANMLRLNYKIPKRLKKSHTLNKFYEDNRNIKSYFRRTRSERKSSHFIENDLLRSNIFDKPIYIWELVAYCHSQGKNYTSKQLSQILEYLVTNNKLEHKKRPLKLRNGEYGDRDVYVYYKKPSKT